MGHLVNLFLYNRYFIFFCISGPGKLNTSAWEQKTADPAKPAGARGKAAMFEQAAKDSAPKDVQKKVSYFFFYLFFVTLFF